MVHLRLIHTGTKLELSVEFFPPKTEEGMSRFLNTAEELSTTNLNYASVTYGAGGSTREGTLLAVENLDKIFGTAVPHISCIGSTKELVNSLLYEYQKKNLRHLIVLRGDLPSGFGRGGEFTYAVDLVKFIKKNFDETFRIDVAAYPETHPQAKSSKEDILNFVNKVNAGASGAITQYFYNIDAYVKFVNDVNNLGVDIPIVPGIMPITNFNQLARFSDACGAEIPRWIRNRLSDYADDSQSIYKFGIEIVSNLCEKLIANGVPGLHFYSMNRSKAILDILSNLGIKT